MPVFVAARGGFGGKTAGFCRLKRRFCGFSTVFCINGHLAR
jgi:hypothetical protein